MSDDEPRRRVLRMYGEPTDASPLSWTDVVARLRSAETYWVVAATTGVPHPRPVWGIWDGSRVLLSLGSPVLRRQLTPGAPVAVHLDSGTDVVVVEGAVEGPVDDAGSVAAYDEKYDWSYDVERFGPFTAVTAHNVLAWQAAGPAGRDGFTAVASWRIDRAN